VSLCCHSIFQFSVFFVYVYSAVLFVCLCFFANDLANELHKMIIMSDTSFGVLRQTFGDERRS